VAMPVRARCARCGRMPRGTVDRDVSSGELLIDFRCHGQRRTVRIDERALALDRDLVLPPAVWNPFPIPAAPLLLPPIAPLRTRGRRAPERPAEAFTVWLMPPMEIA